MVDSTHCKVEGGHREEKEYQFKDLPKALAGVIIHDLALL